MYVDDVIRIGFGTDGGFFISYDKNIAKDSPKEEETEATKGVSFDEQWRTKYVPDVAAAVKALEVILDKAVKPKAKEDMFSDAFKEAVSKGE